MGQKLKSKNRLKQSGGNKVKIAVIAAMSEELAPLRNFFPSTMVWRRGKTIIEEVHANLYLVESGIGKTNAAATSAWLCEKIKPDLIINTGTTGAFQSDIPLGSVIYSPTFLYSDVDATGFGYKVGQVPQMPAQYPVDEALLQKTATILKQAKIDAREGLIVTSDSFMSDLSAIATIRQKFPTIVASDMESAAIAQVAHFYQIPVLNIRGVSDHVGQEAPETFEATLELAANNVVIAVKTLLATGFAIN